MHQLSSFLLITVVGIASAQAAPTLSAAIGQSIVLGQYHETQYHPASKQCTVLQAPAIVITERPKHGRISLQRTEADISDPRCPGVRGPVIALVYQAQQSHAPYDRVTWNVVYQTGQQGTQTHSVQIAIQPAKRATD